MERKTPLYDEHVAWGGKIVPFAGYLLPVQYGTGVIAEHMAVRQKAGLFDVSHMGEVILSGKDALANIQMLLTNDYSNLETGQARYSPMCNEQGGVVDDLIVYKLDQDRYLIVVNAANREKDVTWMESHLHGEVHFADVSDHVAQLALQGPKAMRILSGLARLELVPERYYTFIEKGEVAGIPCMISKTGYTGEDGVELYCKPDDAPVLWEALLKEGQTHGLIPCGLGARDTLRLEAAMPLYGHEMNEEITPKEAGLGIFIKMSKADFIGRQALVEKGDPVKKRVGLKMTGRGIAREGCAVYAGDQQIGWITSGTHCPYLGKAVAMAILPLEYKEIGTTVTVDVRGRLVDAEVVKLPFYSRG